MEQVSYAIFFIPPLKMFYSLLIMLVFCVVIFFRRGFLGRQNYFKDSTGVKEMRCCAKLSGRSGVAIQALVWRKDLGKHTEPADSLTFFSSFVHKMIM